MPSIVVQNFLYGLTTCMCAMCLHSLRRCFPHLPSICLLVMCPQSTTLSYVMWNEERCGVLYVSAWFLNLCAYLHITCMARISSKFWGIGSRYRSFSHSRFHSIRPDIYVNLWNELIFIALTVFHSCLCFSSMFNRIFPVRCIFLSPFNFRWKRKCEQSQIH